MSPPPLPDGAAAIEAAGGYSRAALHCSSRRLWVLTTFASCLVTGRAVAVPVSWSCSSPRGPPSAPPPPCFLSAALGLGHTLGSSSGAWGMERRGAGLVVVGMAGSKASRRHERESPGGSKQSGGQGGWRRRKDEVGDEDEEQDGGGEGGNRPAHWPSKVMFSQKLRWGSSSTGGDKDYLKRRQLPGIRVHYITDTAHPLKGQYGVWATRDFEPFEVVGEYVGKVVPPGVYGEYVATIDYGDKRREAGVEDMYGVDSQHYGNEMRMANHFKGIATYPNVKLITAYIAELPHILVVVMRPIKAGEELLLDYGPHYWLSKYHAPPPDPLNPSSSSSLLAQQRKPPPPPPPPPQEEEEQGVAQHEEE